MPINPITNNTAILFLFMSFQFKTIRNRNKEMNNSIESMPEHSLLMPTTKSPTPSIGPIESVAPMKVSEEVRLKR